MVGEQVDTLKDVVGPNGDLIGDMATCAHDWALVGGTDDPLNLRERCRRCGATREMVGPPVGPTPPQRQPLPAEILGANLALLVGAVARHLPEELAPQSRYQVAVDLVKSVIASDLARTLAP